MSKEACHKEIYCLGKAIAALQANIDQLTFKRDFAIKKFGTLDIEDVELGTVQAEEVLRINKKIDKVLME